MDMTRALRSAVRYFAIAFGADFVLGSIRVPFLVPRLGERTAELIEMPIMLVVIVLGARWVVGRLAPPPRAGERLVLGVVALVLLLAVEFSVVLWVRGLGIGQYFAQRDPVAGAAYAVMLVVFALLPSLVCRRAQVPQSSNTSD